MTIRHYKALRNEIHVVQKQVGSLGHKYDALKTSLPVAGGSKSKGEGADADPGGDADDEDEEPLFKSTRKPTMLPKHRDGLVTSFQVMMPTLTMNYY